MVNIQSRGESRDEQESAHPRISAVSSAHALLLSCNRTRPGSGLSSCSDPTLSLSLACVAAVFVQSFLLFPRCLSLCPSHCPSHCHCHGIDATVRPSAWSASCIACLWWTCTASCACLARATQVMRVRKNTEQEFTRQEAARLASEWSGREAAMMPGRSLNRRKEANSGKKRGQGRLLSLLRLLGSVVRVSDCRGRHCILSRDH